MEKKRTQSKSKSADVDAKRADSSSEVANKLKKRTRSDSNEYSNSRKMPKQAAACIDFKHKSVRTSDKTKIVKRNRVQIVEEESMAISLTTGENVPRPNRRLTNFIFHNADGTPQPFEMIQVEDIFISGLVLPLEETSDKEKETGIRCHGFGRIETWAISGYEEAHQSYGSP